MDTESSQDSVEHANHTLAHRLVNFFYDRHATTRDSWDVSFWNEFCRLHPDVSMNAKDIRTYFFRDVLGNPPAFEGLRREVVQYVNPLFNQIRVEVLEFRDLMEGIDYVCGEPDTPSSVSTNNEPPPMSLLIDHPSRNVSESASTKRFLSPTVAQIQEFVAEGLSELLWTEDEHSSKPTLSLQECLIRTAFLTEAHISLKSCIEPGMKCYERFERSGLIEPLQDENSESTINELSRHQLAASTPMANVTPLGLNQTTDNTLREPLFANSSLSLRRLDYSTILRHVRSKPRKHMFI